VAESSNVIDTTRQTSLPGMFFAQAQKFGDRPFLWAKVDDVYRPHSWSAVAERITAAARGLRAAGLHPGDRVLLVSENRPEWLIADIAIMGIGAIAVPAYTTNTDVNHLHLLNDSGARFAIVSTPQLARHVISACAEADNKVTVYVMDQPERTMHSEIEVRPWADQLSNDNSPLDISAL
jgi:long-chain acyl-CoA synthetase